MARLVPLEVHKAHGGANNSHQKGQTAQENHGATAPGGARLLFTSVSRQLQNATDSAAKPPTSGASCSSAMAQIALAPAWTVNSWTDVPPQSGLR